MNAEYTRRLNTVLRQGRDLWGEELIAQGGANAARIEGYLRPLFWSTGDDHQVLGVHSLLFGEDGGEPPYIIPLADGSRLAATVCNAPRRLEFAVGPDGAERFGRDLERLDGPRLAGGWYPVLQVGYTDAAGVTWQQESFAARHPGVAHLVAWVRFRLPADRPEPPAALTVRVGDGGPHLLRTTGVATWSADHTTLVLRPAPGEHELYLLWSPGADLPVTATASAAGYAAAKAAWQGYWDGLLARGAHFTVPEPLVMDAQRALLVQNLVMRWRYSLGAVVYHGSFYQPESSDAVTTLGLYGFAAAHRDGLTALLGMTKGQGMYTNWERGEKLTHGAHYYLLTRDAAFLRQHTAEYLACCEALAQQIAADPHHLLEKQRPCGDLSTPGYQTFHLAVAWRGLRDLAEVWNLTGEAALHARFRAVADQLRDATLAATAKSATWLPDGSYFVPATLLEGAAPWPLITDTRVGSYWNLCMPYAFSSGLWAPHSREMDGIVHYLHTHGAVLLGLLRFNYYPVAVGQQQPDGLPGYRTTGYDNVYLPSYLRVLADRDDAERLLVSFYGKLLHAQTRNTFVSGEGETVSEVPGERFRSCYGAPNSGNNVAFLLTLRLLLVRESFDPETGLPAGLFLAAATPREWLADGKTIAVADAPTCFGPLAYTLTSQLAHGHVTADVTVPARDPIRELRLKLRVPGGRQLRGVTVNGQPHPRFDVQAETIDLTGLTGQLHLVATYGD